MTDQALLSEMRERFSRCQDHDSTLRREALDDVKFAFIPGNQWDEALKAKRKKRPCYEFNRIRQSIKQVVNDIRKNRPRIKVRAVDSGADRDTAEIYDGIIRNIETVSNADTAYESAVNMAASGGFGAFRITTDYADDNAFEQDIFIKEIRNPFSVSFDPAAQEWDRRDGMFCFVTNLIGRDEFKNRWPNAEISDFEGVGAPEWAQHWYMEDKVRIAEYWVKEPTTKTICLLSNGETVEKTPELESVLDEMAATGISVVREREVKTHKIKQYLMSGDGQLEPPTEWAGRYIPVIPVWGELINVEGRDIYCGMVRHSKDPARAYNFNRTASLEQSANTPLAPYMVTGAQIKSYEKIWRESNSETFPFLPYNVDPQAPGLAPQRIMPPQLNVAAVELARLDAEDIKATTGIYDASMGARSNETSGRAILAREQQGDTANFDIVDNLARALKFAGDILVDLIPKIYDNQRAVRILGEDGSERTVQLYQEVIDQQTGQPVRVNDISRGKFDVSVTVGPSYTTQRMEAADQLQALASSNRDPLVGLLLTSALVKNLDAPGMKELEKPIRKMLVKQGLIEPDPDDPEEAPQQEAPNPMQQAEMMLAEAKIGQESEKTKQEQIRTQKLAEEAQGVSLDNQKRQLEAQVIAKSMEPDEARALDNEKKRLEIALLAKKIEAAGVQTASALDKALVEGVKRRQPDAA